MLLFSKGSESLCRRTKMLAIKTRPLGYMILITVAVTTLFSFSSQPATTQTSGYSITDLGTLPGYNESSAAAVNASGQVVGSVETITGISHAYLYNAGVQTDLSVLPGYVSSYAFAINSS